MSDDILRVLISEYEIKNKIKDIGFKINNDYKGKDLVLISILKGAVIFVADLMREINLPCMLDFMSVSSYGSGAKTSGVVKINKDLEVDIENKDVLIIEDILDSGMTLNYILGILKSRNPKTINLCTLLDKPHRREIDINIKYSGFIVPDEFIIGYGLDYDEKYRNLPYIASLKPEMYNKEGVNLVAEKK